LGDSIQDEANQITCQGLQIIWFGAAVAGEVVASAPAAWAAAARVDRLVDSGVSA